MENIKINDMTEGKNVSEQEMAAVKGGPAYLKLDGVDGEVRDKGHDKWSDLLSVSHNR